MTTGKASERRDGPRIDLRLRVRYEAAGANGEAEASDVSPKGLRLESDKPVEKGTQLKLHVDAGEAEELEAIGYVTWCRQHTTPTGKVMYDFGVAFESDWLAKDRGPLGSALARIFAMNSYEPARNFERTPVALIGVTSASPVGSPEVSFEIANLSMGGMQVRSKGPLGEQIKAGLVLSVAIDAEGTTRTVAGRVAWVAGAREAAPQGPRLSDSFGVEFANTTADDRAYLERIRMGQLDPTRLTVTLA